MSSLYSTNLKIELIGTGDQTGVWGGTTNTNLGTAIEQAIVGKASLVTGDFTANVATLTLTDTNASQTARAFVLDVTATLSAAGTINVPAVQKPYIVFNNTVGGFALTIKVSGLTGVVVPNGKRMLVYNNGTDVIDGLNYLNGAATSATTATNLASGVANNIPYQTGAGATSFITAPSTPGYVLGWNGTNFIWVAAPASTTSVNLLGGSAGVVPYQSATDTTAFTAVGTSGKALLSAGAGTPTWADVNLTSAVTGTLPIANGGTNSTATATAGGVGYGTGTAHAYTAVGTSGQYLQSAGAGVPVWAAVTIPGTGGTTGTGSITLTASSPAAMTITPTTPGLYVTLPDATTCTKADNLFSVYNAGDYDYGVKNSAGTQLGWIRSRTGAMIGLADNATAAGTWAYYGLEKLGVTASYVNMTATNMEAQYLRRITLDANRTCFLFGGTNCYAVVYDASTQTWGSAALVRSGVASGAFIGVLSATNQVLVVSNDSTIEMRTVTLTIAGTGVTFNTPVSTTLAGNFSSFGQLIAVSSSWVLSYSSANSASSLCAIIVSGTVPTIGSTVIAGSASLFSPVIFASGSVVRSICQNATNLRAIPYTVSGTTLTIGTLASVATTSSANIFRAFLNGNGNIVCEYINTTHYATVFKLTGTVEAASSVSLGTVPQTIINNSDYVQVTASKTAFLSGNAGTWACNILTDTAGTASVGTEITGTTSGTPTFCQLPSTGNNATFAVGENNGAYSSRTFDCSGASPVASSSVRTFLSSTITITPLLSTDIYGIKNARTLIGGQVAYSVSSGVPTVGSFSVNSVETRIIRPTFLSITPSVGETGSITYTTTTPTFLSTTGILIQKVEAAA